MGRCNVIKASTSRCLLFQEEVLWNCADPVSLAFLVHDSIEWLVRIDPRFNGATNFLLSPLNGSSFVSPLYSNFTLSRHSYPRTWFIEPSKKKIPFQKIIILDFIFEFVLKKVSRNLFPRSGEFFSIWKIRFQYIIIHLSYCVIFFSRFSIL